MPRVRTYGGQQVETQIARQPQAQASGAPGRALQNLGQATSGMAQQVQAMQERIATTEAEEALLQFEKEKNRVLFDPEEGYFNTQGRNAFEGSSTARQRLEELREQHAENLNSEQAREMFTATAQEHVARAQTDIMRHASDGLNAWETATIEAQAENAMESGALYWNNPERREVQRQVGRQAIIDAGERRGIGSEALNENLQNFESKFTRNTIQSAMRQNVGEAERLLDEMGDRMEPGDRATVEDALETAREEARTEAIASQAVNIATELTTTYDSRQEIIDQLDTIEDPELRKEATSEAMYQLNQRKKAESEARGEAFETAEQAIINQGVSPAGFRAANPQAWQRLSPKQRRKLESGESVKTNYRTFSDLMLLPEDKLADVDPAEYFDELGETERKQLISAVRSARGEQSEGDERETLIGRTRTSELKSAVEQVYGDPNDADDETKAQIDAFYAMVTNEVKAREAEQDRKLNISEFREVITDLSGKVARERSFGIIPLPDAEEGINEIPAQVLPALENALRLGGHEVNSRNLLRAYNQGEEAVQSITGLPQVPPQDAVALRRYLRDNNIPVTPENMLRAYEQARTD